MTTLLGHHVLAYYGTCGFRGRTAQCWILPGNRSLLAVHGRTVLGVIYQCGARLAENCTALVGR